MAGTMPTTSFTALDLVGSQLNNAAAVDPEPISKTIIEVAGRVLNMFTAHHKAAMAREAQALNAAIPNFVQEVSSIVDGLNQGALSESDALSYLAQSKEIYYQATAGIIKGKWPYQGGEYPEPTWADSYENRSGPYGSKDTNPDSHAPGTCNAACVLGHYLVERTVFGLSAIIQNGGGTIDIEPFPNNGMIQGTPGITLTYQRSLLGGILPASVSQMIPPIVRAHPFVFGLGALILGVVAFKGR